MSRAPAAGRRQQAVERGERPSGSGEGAICTDARRCTQVGSCYPVPPAQHAQRKRWALNKLPGIQNEQRGALAGLSMVV